MEIYQTEREADKGTKREREKTKNTYNSPDKYKYTCQKFLLILVIRLIERGPYPGGMKSRSAGGLGGLMLFTLMRWAVALIAPVW